MAMQSGFLECYEEHYIIFITQKIGASDQNGLQIRIQHRKIHRIKEKNILFFIWP